MRSSTTLVTALIGMAALGASSLVFPQEIEGNMARPDKPADTAQAQPKDKADSHAAKPARQPRKPPPRRHVWQVVGPEPTVNLGSAYSPTLTPRQPGAPAIGTAPVSPGPAQLNSCVGNLCTDSSGRQYNVGTGNAGVDSQGRLCNRVGTTMQCF
jgi:hypothetical protein